MNFYLQQLLRKTRNSLIFPIAKKLDYVYKKREHIEEDSIDKLLAVECLMFIIQYQFLDSKTKFIKERLYVNDLCIYISGVTEYCELGAQFPIFSDSEWDFFNEERWNNWKGKYSDVIDEYVNLSVTNLFSEVYAIEKNNAKNKTIHSAKNHKRYSVFGFRKYIWNFKYKKGIETIINALLILLEVAIFSAFVYLFIMISITGMRLLNTKVIVSLFLFLLLILVYILVIMLFRKKILKKNSGSIERYENRKVQIIKKILEGIERDVNKR